MKKIILTCLIAWTLTGCLDEGMDGCPSVISMSFTHNDSTQEFDDKIGNDIHLQIYKDDILFSAIVVPFEEVKGGRELEIRKEFIGDVDIVAWAVPSVSSMPGQIPDYLEGESKSNKILQLSGATKSSNFEAMGDLFLGTVSYHDTDISRQTSYKVNFLNCICQFSVSVYDSELFQPGGETPAIEIYGSKSEMNLDFDPLGQDAIITAGMTYDETNKALRTGKQGLLPSAEDQYLSFTAFKGDTPVFTVETNHQSKPGSVIEVEIIRGGVILTVDGWRVFDAEINWL